MSGKNIVLCSDGTGQAGGQGFVSNVWRIFKAVDRHHDNIEQVAFHADGVGSEKNKLARAIGGAFGWGLGQDIRQLYASLVRSYREGDRIFLFGFSRGAFTVRSLAGMVERVGILQNSFTDDRELMDAVEKVYMAYRKDDDSRLVEFDTHPRETTRIRFLGVWDTVDAIGVPIDEIRDAIYAVARIWRTPHRVALNAAIDTARQALSIDDERLTFHPMIWNENGFGGDVKQMWFTGVHSNVGGGYPKDSLAFISLDWMMKQAKDCGLEFLPSKWVSNPGPTRQGKGGFGDYQEQADRNGRIYDSRGGAAAYYRYKPRDVTAAWEAAHDGAPGPHLPIVHESVLLRTQSGNTGYVPIALNGGFDYEPTWSTDIDDVVGRPNHDAARPFIRLGRFLHAALIVWSIAFLATGLILMDGSGDPCAGGSICTAILDVFKGMTPGFADGWLNAWAANTGWLAVFIVILAGLIGLRSVQARAINRAANAAWKKVQIILR